MSRRPDEVRAALTVAALPGIGAVTARRRREEAASFCEALAVIARDVPSHAVQEASRRADDILASCNVRGIDALPFGDAEYPSALAALEDPPVVLFAEGRRALTQQAAVALVGSRQATPYGRRVARELARRLAAHGVVVVSGLAAGIDAEAHDATLAVQGATIAVLGTGLDIAYPAANQRLQRAVAREGLLLSELPPGRRAHAGAFPRRNRIIAALADVVVVVEAGERSGALITAQVGGAAGRIVAAVPGRMDDAQSVGTNRLLRDGAQVIAAMDDVLGLVSLTARGRNARSADRSGEARESRQASEVRGARGTKGAEDETAAPESTSRVEKRSPTPTSLEGLGAEARVLAVLANGARTPDELVRACETSPREVGAALATLSVRGAVGIDAAGLAYRLDRDGWGAP